MLTDGNATTEVEGISAIDRTNIGIPADMNISTIVRGIGIPIDTNMSTIFEGISIDIDTTVGGILALESQSSRKLPYRSACQVKKVSKTDGRDNCVR